MSRGFHSEDELYSMQNSSIVGHFDHWNHIPYDCSYPQFTERPRIAERSNKDGKVISMREYVDEVEKAFKRVSKLKL